MIPQRNASEAVSRRSRLKTSASGWNWVLLTILLSAAFIGAPVADAADAERSVRVEVPAVDADGRPIEDELHIRMTAQAVRPHLVRAFHQRFARACELDFLEMGSDDLDIAVQ